MIYELAFIYWYSIQFIINPFNNEKKKVAVHKKNIANSCADFLAKMGAEYMIEFYI
jgi:hypothetical protein